MGERERRSGRKSEREKGKGGAEGGDGKVEMGNTGRWVWREMWVFMSKYWETCLSWFCEY